MSQTNHSEIILPEKKLGFGMMRLPKRGLGIDIEQSKKMVDRLLEAGFTYFDTALVYLGSEEATRKALVERHPRDSFTLATKLYAVAVPTEKMAKKELQTSLKRLGTDYVDYYLLHSLMESNYKKYERFHLWDFVREEKEKGTIRHYGFSYHSGPELLDQLLTEHPDAEFVQLQINYEDWENPAVTARANYEVARKHGKPVVIMEPVKGGNLANPPKAIRELFSAAHPDWSYASWALRYAASLEGVLAVLSGMSTLEQVEDNVATLGDFAGLGREEQAVIYRAQEILGAVPRIPCTSCRYCTEGCPQKISIPDIFKAMNQRLQGYSDANERYEKATPSSKASDCIACGRCEQVCPQHIPIIDKLRECAQAFE